MLQKVMVRIIGSWPLVVTVVFTLCSDWLLANDFTIISRTVKVRLENSGTFIFVEAFQMRKRSPWVFVFFPSRRGNYPAFS